MLGQLKPKGSKKAKFMKVADGTPWQFLLAYWRTFNWYDGSLRTPEVHSGSFLRKQIIDQQYELDRIQGVNVISNLAITFYRNVLLIIQGREPLNAAYSSSMRESEADIMGNTDSSDVRA
jgi:hypothetical protein